MTPAHFGEWLQGRLGPDGPLVLITLACPEPAVRAGTGDAVPGAKAFSRALGVAETAERVTPLFPPGGGCGVSTASLLAVAHRAGVSDPDRLARACIAVEGASDPLMWPDADRLLWAPRDGRIVERLPAPGPFEIVGGFYGPPVPTDPADRDFPDIKDLVDRWRTATAAERPALASVSADRTTALRGPDGDPTARLARRLGARGHARAHTGSARALIFPKGDAPARTEDVLRDAGLTACLRFTTGSVP